MSAAIGPWPCPSEMLLMRAPPIPFVSANLSSAAIGSAPGERMKISGVHAVESRYVRARSKGGGSMYLRPSFSETNSETAGTILSGRRQRSNNSFWNDDSFVSQSPGSGSLCGSGLSNRRFHLSSLGARCCARPLNDSKSDRRVISPHDLSDSHAESGLAILVSRAMPPVSKKNHSAPSISPASRRMSTHIMNEKSSLSFSSSDRHTLQYSEYVRWLRRCFRRVGTSSDFSLSRMDATKRLMNQLSEYWYIGSTLVRSAMLKNSVDECLAIGRYPSRVASIFFSVSSAIACLSLISLASTLDDDST
eukprot:Opistho-2@93109